MAKYVCLGAAVLAALNLIRLAAVYSEKEFEYLKYWMKALAEEDKGSRFRARYRIYVWISLEKVITWIIFFSALFAAAWCHFAAFMSTT